MQTCFREHPDIYGAELQDDDDDDAPPTGEDAPSLSSPTLSPISSDAAIPVAATSASPEPQPSSSSVDPSTTAREGGTSNTERAQAAKRQVERDHGEPTSESDELVPKAAHDATGVDARK